MTAGLPEYIARRVERRRGCQAEAVTVAWGHLYRVRWLDSGFNHRTGDYYADVPHSEWVAFDPEGHLVATTRRRADALRLLDEERQEPGLHASSWVTTWRVA